MSTIVNEYLNLLQLSENEIIIESINVHKILDWTKEKLHFIETELRKYHIDVNGLKNFGKILAKKFNELYEKGKSPEEASNILKSLIVNKVKDELKKVSRMGVAKGILVSIAVFILLIIVNTQMFVMCTLILGPYIGLAITAIIIGPITEETVKKYFIEQKRPYLGTGIVFGLEFLNYVVGMLLTGKISLISAILTRIPAYIMHFLSTYIQKKIGETGDSQFPSDIEHRKKIAWATAVIFHSLFNTVAVIVQYSKMGII
jgi:hypothetical protein